jgi:hypothetical protein
LGAWVGSANAARQWIAALLGACRGPDASYEATCGAMAQGCSIARSFLGPEALPP